MVKKITQVLFKTKDFPAIQKNFPRAKFIDPLGNRYVSKLAVRQSIQRSRSFRRLKNKPRIVIEVRKRT